MKYDIATVLSITHDRLLTDMGNVYKILNELLDENLFTHQLPRACKFVRPFILAQHPQLADWDIYGAQTNTDNWREMLEIARKMFGNTLEIEKPPSSVWTEKNPLEELGEMVGGDRVVVVSSPTPTKEEVK